MQQYFINQEININELIELNDDIKHHLITVLRKKDGWKFRIVDNNKYIYLCELVNEKAKVLKKLEEDHELNIDVTIILSLIKPDKFELALQKLVELGVSRIVPYIANRSIIKVKDEDKKLARYQKIVEAASEQSHREIIPEVCNIITYKDLDKYLSKDNYVAYEKIKGDMMPFNKMSDSVTIIIGPEGGFEIKEIENFEKLGFKCKSLGKRILRAETAAIFVMCNIVGVNE